MGDNATDKDRNLAIINKMKDLKDNARKASVVCSLVLYDGHTYIEGKGVLHGYIPANPRGANGFGFDEIFEICDDKVGEAFNGKTLAELTSEEKNIVSARYLAAVDLKVQMDNTLRKDEE